jgi:uncharacterized protein YciI
MLFAVRFYDDPARSSVRTTFFEAHLSWLREHGGRILIAGSLRQEPDVPPVGGL